MKRIGLGNLATLSIVVCLFSLVVLGTTEINLASAAPLTGGEVGGKCPKEYYAIQLHQGWNWIGFLPNEPQPIKEALASIDGKYDFVQGETGTYKADGPDYYNSLAVMEPGKGYMIRMKEAAVLQYSDHPKPKATSTPTATPFPPTNTPVPLTNTPTATPSPTVAAPSPTPLGPTGYEVWLTAPTLTLGDPLASTVVMKRHVGGQGSKGTNWKVSVFSDGIQILGGSCLGSCSIWSAFEAAPAGTVDYQHAAISGVKPGMYTVTVDLNEVDSPIHFVKTLPLTIVSPNPTPTPVATGYEVTLSKSSIVTALWDGTGVTVKRTVGSNGSPGTNWKVILPAGLKSTFNQCADGGGCIISLMFAGAPPGDVYSQSISIMGVKAGSYTVRVELNEVGSNIYTVKLLPLTVVAPSPTPLPPSPTATATPIPPSPTATATPTAKPPKTEAPKITGVEFQNAVLTVKGKNFLSPSVPKTEVFLSFRTSKSQYPLVRGDGVVWTENKITIQTWEGYDPYGDYQVSVGNVRSEWFSFQPPAPTPTPVKK